jgi:hypothetical protein
VRVLKSHNGGNDSHAGETPCFGCAAFEGAEEEARVYDAT